MPLSFEPNCEKNPAPGAYAEKATRRSVNSHANALDPRDKVEPLNGRSETGREPGLGGEMAHDEDEEMAQKVEKEIMMVFEMMMRQRNISDIHD